MKAINFLAIMVIAALAFTACSKDNNELPPPTPPQGGDIEFNIGFAPQDGGNPQTRVATDAQFKSTWENGDEIGVFAVKRASGETKALATTGNYIHNVKLTYSDADGGKWTAASELWHTNDGEVLDFYAYYPYIDNASIDPINITFNVLADQSTAENYNQSDLLSAAATGIAKGTAVDLTFAHKLALVQVEVDPTYIDRNTDFSATLRGCKTGGTFNLGDGSLSTAGDAVVVKMLRVEQPTDANYGAKYTYRALVPAQTVASGTSLCLMAQNGQLFNTPKLGEALALTAGDAKLYTAKLPVTALQTVKIPKGTFIMGSPTSEPNRSTDETQHSVTLTKDFYMSKYQITNAQYAAFLNAKNVGIDGKLDVAGYGEKVLFDENRWNWTPKWNTATNQWESARTTPMIYVSWYGAVAYCNWLSETTGGTWRLPTEAEWEYACRAGTTTAHSFGADNINDYAVYMGNAGNGPSAVGTKLPNPLGLYDMHGNVWEWCSDWYGTYGTSEDIDPAGATSGTHRVLRGGSWSLSAQNCRSADRNGINPGGRRDDVGFRVVFVP